MLNKKDRFDGALKGLDKRKRKEHEGAVTLTFKNKEDKLACMLIEEYYGNLNKIESRVPDLIEVGEAIIKAVDPLNKRQIRLAETESRYEYDSFTDQYKPFSNVYKHEIIGLKIEVESHLNGRNPTLCFTCKFLFPITFKYKTPTTINLRQFVLLQGTLKHNLTLDNNYSFNQLFERWVTGEGKTASLKRADFYREVFPPDQLSSLNQGTPIGKADNPDGVSSHSALPNGDSARNIGRPSPDSPNLKYRNLDKSEANGRTPANKLDLGYVHDSGFGSARVIPYDSGFENNRSPLRNASRVASRFRMRRGSLTNLSQQIKQEYGVELSLLDNGEIIELIKIVIPKDQRGLGLGSKIMGEITAWADQKGKIISLTPSKDFGGSSVSRLVRFYSQFGFKKNKGRNKDFRTRDTMLRYPSEAQGKKVAGLIRPPKKLIDEVALIAQGAVARWLLKWSSNPKLYFAPASVHWVRELSEMIFDLILDIQREDSDLEDTEWLLNALRIEFNKYHKQLLDLEEASSWVFGVIGGLKHAISILDGVDVNLLQANPHEYVKEIRKLSNTTETLLTLMERNQEGPRISPDALKDYEKASSKLPSGYSLYDEWEIQYPTMYPIKILMKFENNKEGKGSHHLNKTPPQHIIKFYVNPTKRGWTKEDLQGVRNTSRHELVHALQIEHKRKKHRDDKGEAGLPFKKRQDDYRQYYKGQEESLKIKYKREGLGNPDFISIHALDDIEFYSRLLDEVVRFQRKHPNPTNEDIRFHLKYSEFFMNLKRFQKKKYNKAVGIFISEVQSNGRKASEKSGGLIQPYRKDFEVLEDATKYLYAFNSKTGLSLIRDKEDIPLTKDYPKILVSDLPQKLISEILSGYFNNPSPKYRFPKEVTSWLNWAKEEEGVFEVEDSIHTQIEKHCNYLSSLIEWTKKQYYKPQTHKSLVYLEIDLDDLTRHHLSIGTILKTIKKIEHFFYACTRYVNKNKEVALRPTPVPKMKWEVTRDAHYGLGVLVPHALLEGFKNDVFLHPLDPKAEDATATHRKFNWGHLIEINLLRPFSTVQKSLHHEIIHGVQSEMKDELGIEGAGKPTSKNQSTGQLQNQGGDHSLDDIEFYTQTNDSIANWGLQVVNRARTISDLNKRIRSEVKWDSFLKTLKRYGESPEGDNGLRWRKATKLIVQTLQNAFKRKQKGEVFDSHLDFVGFKTAKEAGVS